MPLTSLRLQQPYWENKSRRTLKEMSFFCNYGSILHSLYLFNHAVVSFLYSLFWHVQEITVKRILPLVRFLLQRIKEEEIGETELKDLVFSELFFSFPLESAKRWIGHWLWSIYSTFIYTVYHMKHCKHSLFMPYFPVLHSFRVLQITSLSIVYITQRCLRYDG